MLMSRRISLLATLFGAATVGSAQAQAAPVPGPPAPAAFAPDSTGRYPWRWGWLPSFGGGTNDGPLIGARVRGFQMAAYDDRVANRQTLTAQAGVGFRGSFLGLVRYQAPRLGTRWRTWVQLQANRDVRFGYFGLGNNTVNDPNLATTADPLPYSVKRTRFEIRADVTRQLVGPLELALGLHGQLGRFNALDQGASTFRDDFGAGLRQDDASARVALIADTRDVEYDPSRGVLLEAGAQLGAGNGGYERVYGIFRGYAPLGSKTVLAGRIVGSQLTGTPTLDARFMLPGWEQPIEMLGAQFSHRGLQFGRLAGRSALFGNAEVRQEVKNIKGALDVVLVGFVDAGRVFEAESFALTARQLKVAGGIGAGLKILRSSVIIVNLARGPEGWQVTANNGWMF